MPDEAEKEETTEQDRIAAAVKDARMEIVQILASRGREYRARAIGREIDGVSSGAGPVRQEQS